MSEFICVTRYDGSSTALINTDEILRVSQVVEGDEVRTELILRNSLSGYRIRENISQLMMLLGAPIGRYYPTLTGIPGAFGPVGAGGVVYTPPKINF